MYFIYCQSLAVQTEKHIFFKISLLIVAFTQSIIFLYLYLMNKVNKNIIYRKVYAYKKLEACVDGAGRLAVGEH